MKLDRRLLLSIALFVCLTAAKKISAFESLGIDLDRLESLCRPTTSDESWRSIAWMTDLWQARVLAARQGKPILLWEMDGHPLGCT